MSADLRTCPAGCGRDDLRGPQGVATHLSRRHPDYDRDADDAVDRAEGQQLPVELAFSVMFEPDELVLLQALAFLKGVELNDLAAEAFNDLFAWARAQEAVTTLIDLREQWTGELVVEATLTLVGDVQCTAACSEQHTYVEGECAQAVPAP